MEQIQQLSENDDNIIKNYKFINKLGQGSFGNVYQAINIETQLNFAIKIINQKNNQNIRESLQESIEYHNQLNNKNIIRYYEVFFQQAHLFVVMELLEGGSLQQYLEDKIKNQNPLLETEVCQIMKGISNGLQTLHLNGIIHRDLKLDNIMLAKTNCLNSIKIIDFGLSISLETNSKNFRQKCGTLLYLAPECLQRQYYSKPVDIWSLGIIMYYLISQGKHPFFDKKEASKDLYEQIQLKNLKIPSSLSQYKLKLYLIILVLDKAY